MKKILIYFVLVVMLFALLPATAFATNGDNTAEEELAAPIMEVSIAPTELLTGGDITIACQIKNPNTTDINNATLLVDDSEFKSIGTIVADQTVSITGKYTVQTAKIGQNIAVKLVYEGGSVIQTIKIAQKQARVSVNTVCKVDKTTAPKNGIVNFSFAIENNGDTKIENVIIKADALNQGKPIASEFSLEAGNAKIVPYQGTIMKSILVKPVLSFTAAGKQQSIQLDPITITMTEANIDINASTDVLKAQEGESLNVTLQLKNSGNVDLSNLKVLDPAGNSVPLERTSIAAGESMSISYAYALTSETDLVFQVTGTDGEGNPVTFTSNPLTVTMEEPEPIPSEQTYSDLLTLKVSADKTHLKAPGEVVFTLTLNNSSSEAFKNLVISEKTLGEIETYSSFPNGEKDITYTAKIEEKSTFSFQLTALDPNGNETTVYANDISITFEDTQNTGSSLNPLIIIIIIVIVLIIGVAIALVILIVKDKKQKELTAKRRAAAVSDTRLYASKGNNRAPERAPERPTPAPDRPHNPQRQAERPSTEEEFAAPSQVRTRPAFIPEIEPKPTAATVNTQPKSQPEEPSKQAEKPSAPPTNIPPIQRRTHKQDFDDRNMF